MVVKGALYLQGRGLGVVTHHHGSPPRGTHCVPSYIWTDHEQRTMRRSVEISPALVWNVLPHIELHDVPIISLPLVIPAEPWMTPVPESMPCPIPSTKVVEAFYPEFRHCMTAPPVLLSSFVFVPVRLFSVLESYFSDSSTRLLCVLVNWTGENSVQPVMRVAQSPL